MRLFLAIHFNDADREEILRVQSNLRRSSQKGNFTRAENLHMTLVFLGEVSPDRLPDIANVMHDVEFEEFRMYFDRLGFFKPGKRRESGKASSDGATWWIGVEENTPGIRVLELLQKELAEGLTRAGFSLEDRKFKPHLTLGREIVFPEKIDMTIRPIQCDVSRISLMKSDRVDGTLVYTELFGKGQKR